MTTTSAATPPEISFVCRRGVQHTILARVVGKRIVTLQVIADHTPFGVGQIYIGRVVRLVDDLRAAFVDIGAARPGFLTLNDVAANPTANIGNNPPLRSVLREGQWVIVQIRREADGDKGARLTMRISLAGRYVVATRDAPRVTTSQRWPEDVSFDALHERLLPLAQQTHAHLLLRTNAARATPVTIAREAESLCGRLAAFEATREHAKKARLLAQEIPPVARALLEAGAGAHATLYVDDPSLQRTIETHLSEDHDETAAPRVLPFAQWRGKDSHLAFVQTLQKALSPRVYLAGGGNIIIEKTQAMWTIDVNSAQAVGHARKKASKQQREQALDALNVEAASVAGEQIVLRNLAGLVAIDCIERGPDNARAAKDALKAALQTDRQRFYVSPQTDLGVVTLTRTQRRSSFTSDVLARCGRCDAPDAIVRTWYVATRALWASDAWLSDRLSPMMLIHCATSVAMALWDEGHALLSAIAARHRTSIVPIARADWPAETIELIDTGAPGDTFYEQIQDGKDHGA